MTQLQAHTHHTLSHPQTQQTQTHVHEAYPQETFTLGPFRNAPRLWTGLWQLSSNAWGSVPAAKVRAEMMRYAEMGYTAFGTFSSVVWVKQLHQRHTPFPLARDNDFSV